MGGSICAGSLEKGHIFASRESDTSRLSATPSRVFADSTLGLLSGKAITPRYESLRVGCQVLTF